MARRSARAAPGEEAPLDLLGHLVRTSTLRAAWQSVAANGGVAGIDRVSIPEFKERLAAELEALAEELRSGSYRALPVLRVRPRFLGASERALVVPTVRDRVVQRAAADLLTPRVEPLLSPACRAFRKGHSAKEAAEDVGRWVEESTPWVLRTDIEGYYDHVDPERLREMLEPLVDDKSLRFLDRLLHCRIFDRNQVSELVAGIPQGSPLSPVLGNLYLAGVDRAIRKRWRRYLRYCDDLIVLAASEEDVRAARTQIEELIDPLGLHLNEGKTRICRAEDGFVFLGYHFGPAGRGPAVKAVDALRTRLDELSADEAPDVAAIDAVYRGWVAYFGTDQQPWLGSPAGLIALLRGDDIARDEEMLAQLVGCRSQLASHIGEPWARVLADAWQKAGWPEIAWLELAAVAPAIQSQPGAVAAWAAVLEVRSEDITRWSATLAGPFQARLEALEEALGVAGRYGLAQRLAALESAWSPQPGRSAAAPGAETGPCEFEDDEIEVLLDFFRGREGVYSVETVDRAGRRRFRPVERPLEADDWKAHLRGEVTLALPLIVAGNLAWLGVFDIDVERRMLDSHFGRPDELLGRALGAALRLRAELERRGVAALLEASGRKGYHVWIRLAEPAAAGLLRRWLRDVESTAGPFPEGINVEIFPNRDRVRQDKLGPIMKLPLGVHSATGRHCALLDRHGEPLDDPVEVLRDLPRLPAEVVREAVAATAGSQQPQALQGLGPRAALMIEGCRVLRYLTQKAETTLYLNHGERLSLLCTLGHLGEEGCEALHAVISHTFNYKRDVTERHFRNTPSWPMSCPKLRERHPEAVARGGCPCPRKPRGRGYPTPVLLALKPSEIQAFRPAEKRPSKKGAPEPRPPAAEAAPGGVETPDPAPGDRPMAQGGSEAPDALTRIRPPREDPDSDTRRRCEAALERLRQLRHQSAELDAAIAAIYDELDTLFESADIDRLQTASGTLRRTRAEDGKGWEYLLEL